jgi:gamma-glutamyl-gamma-aminobutyrate hydrolase PuuD
MPNRINDIYKDFVNLEINTRKIEEKEIKKVNSFVVGIAYPAFLSSIKRWLDRDILVVKDYRSEIRKCNLVIFSGGEDLSPSMYGERNFYSSYDERRDDIESMVFNYCMEYKIKMFGICRGHQLLNVLNGGNLHQDLYFNTGKAHSGWHPLENVTKKSLVGCFDSVNSLHHQGINRFFGDSSFITSTHEGIIESFETPSCAGVQFHPEFMEDSPKSITFKNNLLAWAGLNENN